MKYIIAILLSIVLFTAITIYNSKSTELPLPTIIKYLSVQKKV